MRSVDWDYPWLPSGEGNEHVPDSLKAKCTCGATKTMGKDDHWSYHSDYCDLSNQTTFFLTYGERKVKQ